MIHFRSDNSLRQQERIIKMNDQKLRTNRIVASEQTAHQTIEVNYDVANIADIRAAWDEERSTTGIIQHQAYTMVQTNAPCDVKTITKESRKACVEALLR